MHKISKKDWKSFSAQVETLKSIGAIYTHAKIERVVTMPPFFLFATLEGCMEWIKQGRPIRARKLAVKSI